MGNNNINLQAAKDSKDDEFYTTYECIEEELSHYTRHFMGKVVLCNCDDPYESNFFKYFAINFNLLGLKKLIATCYDGSPIAGAEMPVLFKIAKRKAQKVAYKVEISEVTDYNGDGTINLADVQYLIQNNKNILSLLKGNGSFDSPECIELLKEADIIVTNPPFSLFKELVSLLIKYNKKYLLIGNQNALTYKEIFPLIQNNEAWTGYRFGEMKFRVPASSLPRNTRFWIDKDGQKWRSLGNAMWLTNLDIDRRHQILQLTKYYTPEEYPRYDNYDAINVRTINDIPKDYPGIMGVPITIINRYNPEQFELIGEANHGSDNEFDLFKPLLNGKLLFKRILIRNKQCQ
ncbi:MAG: adenine-specific methyltransferase EcoRI family protein [Paludibacteraceae bacterium]|nr:adenine-specific methyltransferase EcoRI family protein [Paludibacteraceae bacterium]